MICLPELSVLPYMQGRTCHARVWFHPPTPLYQSLWPTSIFVSLQSLISAIPTMSHQNHFSSWWVLLPCCISVMFGCSSCWWRFLPLFIILLHYCTFHSPLRRFWSGCWCQTCPLVVLRKRILSVINPTSEEFWIVIFLNLLDLIGKYDVMQNLLMCIS